jgi:hypothetical protein
LSHYQKIFLDGVFPLYFQRTEYIEPYVMEPMAIKMLQESPELKAEFEKS